MRSWVCSGMFDVIFTKHVNNVCVNTWVDFSLGEKNVKRNQGVWIMGKLSADGTSGKMKGCHSHQIGIVYVCKFFMSYFTPTQKLQKLWAEQSKSMKHDLYQDSTVTTLSLAFSRTLENKNLCN